ncbi:hypothetical protein HHI36_001530, partial [Cryptolaemus montrouzieri]
PLKMLRYLLRKKIHVLSDLHLLLEASSSSLSVSRDSPTDTDDKKNKPDAPFQYMENSNGSMRDPDFDAGGDGLGESPSSEDNKIRELTSILNSVENIMPDSHVDSDMVKPPSGITRKRKFERTSWNEKSVPKKGNSRKQYVSIKNGRLVKTREVRSP